MINSKEFSKRLEKVMDYYAESASSFAEKVGVQRSSISHILSGRNKPSLDFILKILSTYPEVELYWLLNGKGEFPKIETGGIKEISIKGMGSKLQDHIDPIPTEDKSIERIVIFYSDGTFKNFTQ